MSGILTAISLVSLKVDPNIFALRIAKGQVIGGLRLFV